MEGWGEVFFLVVSFDSIVSASLVSDSMFFSDGLLRNAPRRAVDDVVEIVNQRSFFEG